MEYHMYMFFHHMTGSNIDDIQILGATNKEIIGAW